MELQFSCQSCFYVDYAAAVNKMLLDFKLSEYRFFIGPKSEDKNSLYIDIDDFERITIKDEFPNSTDIATSESLYRWSADNFSVELRFIESWSFGEWPADSRYSMPSKTTYSDIFILTFELEDKFNIKIETDKLKITTKLTIEAENAKEYALFLISLLEKKA